MTPTAVKMVKYTFTLIVDIITRNSPTNPLVPGKPTEESMTNRCNLYKLIDNKRVACCLYPYHHNDMCNFALLHLNLTVTCHA